MVTEYLGQISEGQNKGFNCTVLIMRNLGAAIMRAVSFQISLCSHLVWSEIFLLEWRKYMCLITSLRKAKARSGPHDSVRERVGMRRDNFLFMI